MRGGGASSDSDGGDGKYGGRGASSFINYSAATAAPLVPAGQERS